MPVTVINEIDAGPNQGSQVVYLRGHDGITVEYIQKPA